MSSRTQRVVFLSVCALAIGISGSMAWYKLQGVRPVEQTYTVQKGDTLWAIANDHGVTVVALKEANRLRSDSIGVGLELVIPRPDGGVPAPKTATRKRARRTAVAVSPATPSSTGALKMPVAQPCIAPPGMVDEGLEQDEATFIASEGLDPAQVRAATSAFSPKLTRCLEHNDGSAGSIDLELRVACTGQVDGVRVLDDGGLPTALVGCVSDTVRFIPFPAHGLPDGDTLGWALQVTP